MEEADLVIRDPDEFSLEAGELGEGKNSLDNSSQFSFRILDRFCSGIYCEFRFNSLNHFQNLLIYYFEH